jgi:hypothetical protein
VRNAVAIANRQVHQIIAKDMGDDRGERLSAVGCRLSMWVKNPSPYRREGVDHTTLPTVGKILVM